MKPVALAALLLAALASPAAAQNTPVAVGISGWTGFAPLTLAKEAGIFARNGLDVSIKKIPQASRHLAIQSGDIQCAATTVETWVAWNANGVADQADLPARQVLRRRRHGGAQRHRLDQGPEGQDRRGLAPGTAPYFTLAGS
jgi:NitT/TauT family transport system substrate-binding protein